MGLILLPAVLAIEQMAGIAKVLRVANR